METNLSVEINDWKLSVVPSVLMQLIPSADESSYMI